MSQLTAPVTTQRAARLPIHRPGRAAGVSRPARLRVITGEEVRRSNTGFGVLCALLMTVGLLAVLLLNTARAEQSFALGSLQQTSDRLSDNEEQLRTDLANVQAPQQLALKAQEMGMVPAGEVAYVRTSDHKVLGVAKNATGASTFTVGTLPNTPASTVAGQAASAADRSIVVAKPTPPTPATPNATAKPTPQTAQKKSGGPKAQPTPTKVTPKQKSPKPTTGAKKPQSQSARPTSTR
ncbi:hypothetical protein [Luteipulveratus halotolerans]|uniref:hypothetical protein n=1 Tax=Luteipulveratus halotolerans TaxID=1631356 RepID=UPI000681F253|nr:hypothetical protein [Luteipulveratus halotolerans]